MTVGIVTAVAAALAIGAATRAEAQSPRALSVEARVHAAVPRGAVAERWGTGVGVGVTAAVELVPSLDVYAGYSRTSFDLDVLDDMRAVDSGFSTGLRASLPVSGTPLVPWVRGGLLVHSLEVHRQGGGRTDGGGRPGFEVGGGVLVRHPDFRTVGLNVGTDYRRYRARVLGPDREPVTYVSIGVGVVVAV